MPSHQPNLGAQIPHRSFPTWSYLSAVMDVLENTDDAGGRTDRIVEVCKPMKTLRERRKDRLRRFTQNSLKGKGHWISYIYCERLNLLLRKVNDLTTTIGVLREKAKAGTLSKRLEKPHSHPEQNLDLQL